MFLDLHQQAIQ